MRHMRSFGHLLHLWHHGRSVENVAEYIEITEMEEGTWATDVEMFALIHLLGVCLYVHIDDTGIAHAP